MVRGGQLLKSFVSVLFLVFSVPVLAFAQTGLNAVSVAPAAIEDQSCSMSSQQDIYERPHRIQNASKKYADLCVDTDRFRFSEIVSQTKSEITFTNYRHLDQYWLATLTLNTVVEQAFFHVVKFEAISGVIAAHTQLRLKFSNATPLKLTSQLDPTQSTEVYDLVISFEAARPVDIPYNFALGAVDNYVSVARLLSGAQRLAESTENKTEQYELKIPQDEKLDIALLSIEKSARDGFSRFYNTISENCTTDAFGILDSLNFMQGRFEPFYTVLSNDPIAGPSVDALIERGLLHARFADLDEELEKGISAYKPESMLSVSRPNKEGGLLPYVKNSPYTLVLSSPEEKLLSQSQAQAVKEVQALTYDAVPRALHILGSSLMLSQGDSRDFLFTFLREASVSLQARLDKINHALPDQAVEVSAYFVPWSKSVGKKVNLDTVSSVKARLPFDFYQIPHKELGHVTAGVSKAIETQSFSDLGIQAYAIALQFYLKKDAWSVSLQILGGLNERHEKLSVANTQVDINEFVVPKVRHFSEQPVLLMGMTLTPDKSKSSTVNMEFGSFGGLKAHTQAKSYGQLSVLSPLFCGQRLAVTPALKGSFAEKATGYSVIDYLFHGKSVSFNIFKVDMDVKTQRITNMDVRFNFRILGLPVDCLSRDDVNQSFLQSANEQIEKMVEKLKTTDAETLLTPVVDKILTNNADNDEASAVQSLGTL